MPSGEQLAAELVAAADRLEWDRMHQLLDWGLPGARGFAVALGELDPDDRAAMARRGLEDFTLVVGDMTAALPTLKPLVLALSMGAGVRRATSDESARAAALLQVPPLPPGVPPEVEHHVAELRRRGSSVREIVAIDTRGPKPRRLLFAVTPEGDRLAYLDRDSR